MTMQSFIKAIILAAGICIFAIGLALAQTPPAPPAGASAPQTTPGAPPSTPDRRAMRETCRGKVDTQLRGPERREAMRKCMAEQRQAARGPGADEGRRAARERSREIRRACREELRNQRFTEDERKDAILQCAAKSDPRLARQLACRKEAEEKKLERTTREFRSHMRACMTRG